MTWPTATSRSPTRRSCRCADGRVALRRQPARRRVRVLGRRGGVLALRVARHASAARDRDAHVAGADDRRYGDARTRRPPSTAGRSAGAARAASAAARGGRPGRGRRRRARRARQLPGGAERRPGGRRRRRRRRRLRGRRARHAGADRRRAREHRGRGRRGVRQVPASGRSSSPRPASCRSRARRPCRSGRTVDARKGTVAMASAQNSQGTQRNARLSAGIFLIRQQRAKRGSAAVVGRPRAPERARRRGRLRAHLRARPDQGPLAQHRAQPHGGDDQGPVPVIGGAAITTAPDATWVTGTAATAPAPKSAAGASRSTTARTKTTERVPAGRSYLVKAKLFAARQAAR